MGAKRGKVTIDFADLEDLERIYRLIAGEALTAPQTLDRRRSIGRLTIHLHGYTQWVDNPVDSRRLTWSERGSVRR